MKVLRTPMALAPGGLVVTASPSWAHHAVQAVFDVNKPITVSGSITKVEWINPEKRSFSRTTFAG